MSDLVSGTFVSATSLGISERGERLPPQNINAEVGCIGAILRSGEEMHGVAPLLRPEDFFRDTHQVIYRAMLAVYEEGVKIDPVMVDEELSRRGELGRVDGIDGLIELMELSPNTVNARYYAQIVKQKSIVRRMITAANEITEKGFAGNATAQQVVEFANDRMSAAIEHAATRSTGDGGMTSLMDEVVAWMEARQSSGSRLCGLSTGFVELDRILLGLEPGSLTVIAARPYSGKSILAMNMCEHAAIGNGKHAVFASLEMSRLQLALRLLSSQSSVANRTLRQGGDLSVAELGSLSMAMNRIKDSPMAILDSGVHSFTEIASAARQRARKGKLDLLAIDYLQLMEGGGGKGENRNTEVGKYTRGLKRLAGELGIPVIALSQLNRGPEGTGKDSPRRPRMADIRDSGCVEQDADNIILLHKEPSDGEALTTVLVPKVRNGEAGECKLSLQKAFVRFRDFIPAPANVADTAAY